MDIVRLHFLDSIGCLTGPRVPTGAIIVDVGSGAGFPGVPIKIVRPDTQVTLVEASRKKVAFLELLAAETGLDLEIIHGRAELLGRQPEFMGRFDFAVSRATAALPTLIRACFPLLRSGGLAIFPKGPGAARELNLQALREALRGAGGSVEAVIERKVAGLEGRTGLLVVVRKTGT